MRPIAVGEVLQRLLAGAITNRFNERFAERFAPQHHAVLMSAGTEIAAKSVQSALAHDHTLALLNLDISNAHNAVKRRIVQEGLRDRFPELFGSFHQLYEHDGLLQQAHLASGIEDASSRKGLRQGDPLATALLCLTIQDIFK